MAVDIDVVAFNSAAFIAALFLLEIGADNFVDHTAIVAQRLNVSQTIIALLTAGAEWEELVVVIASLARNRPSLALGNVVGSVISNILGAFSIGLIAHTRGVDFDQSSRTYSILLLAITPFCVLLTLFPNHELWFISGIVLIILFVLYVASAAWAINRGRITAPEGSDDDSDSDSSGYSSSTEQPSSQPSVHIPVGLSAETEPLLSGVTNPTPEASQIKDRRHKHHTLIYHLFVLTLGFTAISLAGYILSHAAGTIADQLGLSDFFFGIVILSIATTLPEKFIAVLSGSRGQSGILVANTVGSNIFLLTLCLGVIMVQTRGQLDDDKTIGVWELMFMWISTLAFTLTVVFCGQWSRVIGWIMLSAYVLFIAMEYVKFSLPSFLDKPPPG